MNPEPRWPCKPCHGVGVTRQRYPDIRVRWTLHVCERCHGKGFTTRHTSYPSWHSQHQPG